MIEYYSILKQILFDTGFVIISIIIGAPLTHFMHKHTIIKLDNTGWFILTLFAGLFILYIIAYIPYPVVYASVYKTIFIICMITAIYLYRNDIKKRFKIDALKRYRLRIKKDYYFAVAILLSAYVYIINSYNVSRFLTGNTMDSGYYTLIAKIIIINHSALYFNNPFVSNPIPYPRGLMMIMISYSFFTGANLIQTTLLITPLFQSMLILSFYSVGNRLMDRRTGVLLSFISAFISGWPQYLVTGSNDFIVALPLAILLTPMIIGLEKKGLRDIACIALFTGYSMAISPIVGEIIVSSMAIFITYNAIKVRSLKIIKKISVLPLSLIPILPSIITILLMKQPGGSYGSGNTLTSLQQFRYAVNIFYLLDNGPYTIVNLELVILALSSISLIILNRINKKNMPHLKNFLMYTAFMTGIPFLILFFSFFTFMGKYINIVINTAEVSMIFFMFIAIFGVLTFIAILNMVNNSNIKKVIALLLLVLLITVPVAYSITFEPGMLYTGYKKYSSTSVNDVAVMDWMKGRLPSNSTILVEPGSGGEFIPAMDGYRIEYPPFTNNYNNISYWDIVTLFENGVVNNESIHLLTILHVNYIFVSEHHTGIQPWNYTIFEKGYFKKYFTEIEYAGSTYLFKVEGL